MEHLDAPLFQTLQTLPAFPFALLVRPDRASVRASREAFFSTGATPTFSYSRADRFDCDDYFRALDAVTDRIESLPALDVVKQLYREKLVELRHRCSLIQAIKNRDDDLVSATADVLFGTSAQSATDLNTEFVSILERSHELHTHTEQIDAEAFTQMARATLAHYGMNDWTIRPTTRPSISIVHAHPDRPLIIKIPKRFSASRARAARVLTHEIETHALRTFNGIHSPILLLGRGLGGYLVTEEGLAIAMQQRLRDNATTDPGFWDAWAAALTQTESFTNAFHTLHDAQLKLNRAMHISDPEARANDAAWRLLVRCMRGIHTPNRSGLGYRRDHIYRSGLIQIRSLLNEHGDAILPTLFAGHASVAHIPMLQSLGITGRTPDFIAKTVVTTVRKEMRSKTKHEA